MSRNVPVQLVPVLLWQPHASLIAAGVKTIETRGWAPPKGLIGQRIAIHAAKAIETSDVRGRRRHDRIAAALNDPEWDGNIPRGAVVCTAILDHAARVTGPERNGQVTVARKHLVAGDGRMGGFRPGPLAVVSPGRGTSGPAGPGPRASGVLELGA